MKNKQIELGSIRVKSLDGGARSIVFVASSDNIDRDHDTVDTASLRIPMLSGGHIVASEIGVTGVEGVDIPLMVNHSLDVTDVIGSVKKAYYVDGELIFDATLADTDKAAEVMRLIDGGHLNNSFSITMADFSYDPITRVIADAEVVEVSAVYRGANRDARLLAVKSAKEENVHINKQNDTHGTANGDGVDHTLVASEDVSTTTEEVAEAVPQDEKQDEKQNEKQNEKQDEKLSRNEKGKTIMNDEIAIDSVITKAAPVQATSDNNYLKSAKALADFQSVVVKHHRGSNEAIMREWRQGLASKGVTGDAILPSAIENIFFKAWTDNPGILGTFRFMNVKAGAVYAGDSEDTAKGHRKGEAKADQTINLIRRDLKALAIYKKLPIDLQDLFDDETGQLLAFRVEELAARIANAIAVGAILKKGDGNAATLQDTRGLYPMADDINATSGYGTKVATKITAGATDGAFEKAVKALGAVKDINGTGAGKVLIVPEGFMTEMKLQKNNNGSLLFPVGIDIAQALGAKAIYEMPELSPSAAGDIEMIAYLDQSYVLVGEASGQIRTDFDLNYNRDVMLQERFVGGSAQGYKTIAGVVKA